MWNAACARPAPAPAAVPTDALVVFRTRGPSWVQVTDARGITTGCGSGIYCPADNVTREQMAGFINRVFRAEGDVLEHLVEPIPVGGHPGVLRRGVRPASPAARGWAPASSESR